MRRVDAIKAKYPNPQSTYSRCGYCVGGAMLMYYGTDAEDDYARFPSTARLARGLMKVSPLTYEAAETYANKIIHYNDAGHFDIAWQTLDEALGEL